MGTATVAHVLRKAGGKTQQKFLRGYFNIHVNNKKNQVSIRNEGLYFLA